MKESRGYSTGNQRRQQIVEQCIVRVAKGGVAALSFEALAQALDLSRPHIKYYFDSKEELLMAAFEEIALTAQKITVARLETKHSWRERLLAVSEAAFFWIEKHPEHAPVLFLYYHYCCVNPVLAKRHAEIREQGRERIRGILSAGLGNKITRAEADAAATELQFYLTGALMEMTTANQIGRTKHFLKGIEKFTQQLIDRLQD